MNIGVAAASLLMIYAGYLGDFAVTSREFGGLGLTIETAAEQILNHFIAPVASASSFDISGRSCRRCRICPKPL